MTNQSGIPAIIIVLLNWNGKEDTLECLASLGKINYSNYRIVIVDNGSTDGSVEAISAQYPDILLLETGENLGYAGGNNVGIRWALENQADYILLLNNDTIVAPDLLTAFMQSNVDLPKGSVLGAKIYYYDHPDELWFAGARWRNDILGFEIIGKQKKDSEQYGHIVQSDYITGCVLLAAAETFNAVGLLDEDFFLTYEETDWCYRARTKGYECFVVPNAHVWHKISRSFGGVGSPIISYFMIRNKFLWMKKHVPRMNGLRLHLKVLLDLSRQIFPQFDISNTEHPFSKRLFWAVLEWFSDFKRNLYIPLLTAKLMGYRDFYLGQLGNCPDSVRLLK
ncbi:MAG: glycosyltransferase family 2 protein [Methylococcales bacterium]|nr:glycosyltransferase family 2 protein [Methylococcales bacterium]